MEKDTRPKAVFDTMMETDAFSQWLGLEGVAHGEGYCKLKMEVRPEMLNGFGIVHGGVSFSLADSALAFAANSGNVLSVTLEGCIHYPNPASVGDVLWAEAREKSATLKTALYDVEVTDGKGLPIAHYRGTVYRTRRGVLS